MPNALSAWTLGALATVAVGCAHAPPRIVSVDFDVWAAAQPPPGVSRMAADRYYSLRPQARAVAERQKIDVVLARDAILYAAPDIDLTPTLLGHATGAARVGERVGVISLQRALQVTLDGKRARESLRQEFVGKQAELDRLQEALKAKYAGDLEAARRSPELAALKQRYAELQRELVQHEKEATRVVLERLVPEVAELARRNGLDVVLEASNRDDVVYRDDVAYPPRGPDLTDALVRLHDERFR